MPSSTTGSSTASSWWTTPAADDTVAVARRLGIETHLHPKNRGYGGNQKTCYAAALAGRRRDHRHAPPRLPVHAAAGAGDGGDDRLRRVRRRPRLAHPRQRRARRRHAALQVRRQPRPHAGREPPAGPEALRVPHRSTAPSGARCSSELPLAENSDDFVFDNEILVQAFAAASASASSPARRSTSPKPRRSTCAARCATASASSRRVAGFLAAPGSSAPASCRAALPGGRPRAPARAPKRAGRPDGSARERAGRRRRSSAADRSGSPRRSRRAPAELAVRLVDRQRPPIDKACGEGLMPAGVRALARARGRMPERSMPFTGIRYVCDDVVAEADFRRRRGRSPAAACAARCSTPRSWRAPPRPASSSIWGRPRRGGAGGRSRDRHRRPRRPLRGRRRRPPLRARRRAAWVAELAPGASRRRTAASASSATSGARPGRSGSRSPSAPRRGLRHARSPPTRSASRSSGAATARASTSSSRAPAPRARPPPRGRAGARPRPRRRPLPPAHPRRRPRRPVALVGDAAGYLDALTGEGLALAFGQALRPGRRRSPAEISPATRGGAPASTRCRSTITRLLLVAAAAPGAAPPAGRRARRRSAPLRLPRPARRLGVPLHGSGRRAFACAAGSPGRSMARSREAA